MATSRRAEQVSLAQARRVALAAQGFAEPRPSGRVDRRHLRRVVERMGLIQIDSVNVLVRSQELPLFARLGPHPRTLIADAVADGELFEYWAHAASILPTAHRHLWRWKMTRDHMWNACNELVARRPGYVESVLRGIEQDGPVCAGDLSERVGKKGQWWDWDDAKIALEHHFWKGQLTASRRASDFARIYDLPERTLPADVLAQPDTPEREAKKELLRMAARHHGIGTVDDLADYHRHLRTPAKTLMNELVEEGEVREVRVEGWDKPAYLHRDARLPRSVDATALLSPFDPVCWFRDRNERLFDFHYRIEIYTPSHKRRFGYYVLPILWGETLAGRIDLKADRATGTLLAPGAFFEPSQPAATHTALAEDVARELRSMAGWLGLERVEVGDRGDLAPMLRRALGGSVRSG